MRVGWKPPDLEVALKGENEASETPITQAMVERWFTPAASGRPAYVDRLSSRGCGRDRLDQSAV